MVDDMAAEAPETGDATGDEAPAAEFVNPCLTFEILQSIKTAQTQHGLRHNDYSRYKQYCSRKLRRLYHAHKLTHGRGKYLRRTLEPSIITGPGQLAIPLTAAERCWAHAMELKTALEAKAAPRKRHHALRRLAKAARHAGELARLAEACGATRTALEADAYAAGMAGLALMEKEREWDAALARLLRAQRVCQQLAQTGSLDQQAVYQKQLTDLAPALRYCRYQIEQHGGPAPDVPAVPDSPSSKLLQVKLEQLGQQAESRPAASSAVASIFVWRGGAYPITSERVRVALGQAAEAAPLADSRPAQQLPREQRLALLDRMIQAYNEAKGFIRHSINTTAAGDSNVVEDLRALNIAVTGTQLERAIDRSLLLLADAKASFDARDPPMLGDGGRRVRAEDLVRLYDTLGAAVKELGDVAAQLGGTAGEVLLDECAAKGGQYEAERSGVLGHAFMLAGKPREAYSLFQRCTSRADEAIDRWESCSSPDPAALAALSTLRGKAKAWQCLAHAETVAAAAAEAEAVRTGVGNIALEGYLLQSLDRWESFAGSGSEPPRLYPIPPPLKQVAVRPFLVDAALNYIEQPNLKHRIKSQEPAGSFASRLFGWGAKGK